MTPRVETSGRKKNQKNCVSRHSQSRKMTFSKDKLDAVRRNPYSITFTYYAVIFKAFRYVAREIEIHALVGQVILIILRDP